MFPDQLVYLVILFLDLTLDTVFHKRNARPAVVIRGHIRRVQTAPQVLNVLLMDVGRSVRLILTVLHARERGLDIYVKIYDEIGLRQAHFHIFEVIKPAEKRRQLLITELAALMDGV